MIDVHIEYTTYGCLYSMETYGRGCKDPEADWACNDYSDKLQQTDGTMVIESRCIYAYPCEHIIHKSVKTFTYDEGEGVRIGRQFIKEDNITKLIIDGKVMIEEEE